MNIFLEFVVIMFPVTVLNCTFLVLVSKVTGSNGSRPSI